MWIRVRDILFLKEHSFLRKRTHDFNIRIKVRNLRISIIFRLYNISCPIRNKRFEATIGVNVVHERNIIRFAKLHIVFTICWRDMYCTSSSSFDINIVCMPNLPRVFDIRNLLILEIIERRHVCLPFEFTTWKFTNNGCVLCTSKERFESSLRNNYTLCLFFYRN